MFRIFKKRGKPALESGAGAGADAAAKDLGRRGEKEAERVLRKKGFKILDRNFNTRYGELDIIARDGDTLVFVEVKTRSGRGFGLPKDSVGAAKQGRLLKAADIYISSRSPEKVRGRETPVRFDVLSIELAGGKFHTEHIENAFGGGG